MSNLYKCCSCFLFLPPKVSFLISLKAAWNWSDLYLKYYDKLTRVYCIYVTKVPLMMILSRFLCVFSCLALLEVKAVHDATVKANNKNKNFENVCCAFLQYWINGATCVKSWWYLFLKRLLVEYVRNYRSESFFHC